MDNESKAVMIQGAIAEAAKNLPQLPVRERGLFRHPNTWTEEEDEIIAEGLRVGLPLQVIGTKVNCERHALVKHIENTPDLKQLKLDCRESRIDQAEFQADRLVKAGNPSMIMFMLERMGRERGWGQHEVVQKNEGTSRVVFGEISEEQISKADAILSKIAEHNNKVFESDPVKAERTAEEATEGTQDFRGTQLDENGNVVSEGTSQGYGVSEIPVEGIVGPAPYDDGGDVPAPDFNGGAFDDPEFAFAEGGDSPFGY